MATLGPPASASATTPAHASTLARASAPPLALRVDRIRCDGYGMCAELLPEFIVLDEWGYPIVRPGALPGDLMGLARRAVDVCPVLALALREYQDPPPVRRVPAVSPEREPDHRAIR
ncbi:MAG TPA: ferredoxin [Candidatus Limnocylindrales bacterium]